MNKLEHAARFDPFLFALYSMDVRPSIARVTVEVAVKVTITETKAPCLSLEDMQSDITRLGARVAKDYTDQTCWALQTEELEAECRLQLVNVLEKNWLTKAKTRSEFFKVLKTAMCNRMRSLVQTYRFTQKRTGIKPPPKNERRISFESTKPKEISLDDPDAHLQVGDYDGGTHEDDLDTTELIREMEEKLAGLPLLIFRELREPSLATFSYAQMDAYRGQTNPDKIKIRITNEHIAQALQVLKKDGTPDMEVFEKAVLTIQQTYMGLRNMNPDDQDYDAVMASLSETFNVQVPKNLSAMHVRRLFTIAARDNWQKVTPAVEKLLGDMGAVAPKFDKDSMRCHGVLYQRNHKICEACGVKVSCAAQAANLGLGEITIHPKLLGAKLRRTPYILPNPTTAPPITTSERDQDIVDYLCRNFKKVTHQSELYFQPKDFGDKAKLIFCVGTSTIPLRLRFCKPTPLLKRKLVYVNKGYYAPDTMPAETVIELINEHARFAYA